MSFSLLLLGAAHAVPAAPTVLAEPSQNYEGFIGAVLRLMETFGEIGVGLAVFLETFIPPIPSEAVLPGAGGTDARFGDI